MTVSKKYDASSITVLDGLEAVRKRPGMYVGWMDTRGLRNLAAEVVDAALGESLDVDARISLRGEELEVVADRAMPSPEWLHRALVQLHCGARHSRWGLGLAVCNALSARFEVELWGERCAWRILAERGDLQSIVRVRSPGEPPFGFSEATRFRLRPDRTIFPSTAEWSADLLAAFCERRAVAGPGRKLTITANERTRTLSFPRGPAEWVERTCQGPTHWPKPFSFEFREKGFEVHGAANWELRSGAGTRILGMANELDTDQGCHIAALQDALELVPRDGRAVTEGLVAAIVVRMPNDKLAFEGSTRERLATPGLRELLAPFLQKQLRASVLG